MPHLQNPSRSSLSTRLQDGKRTWITSLGPSSATTIPPPGWSCGKSGRQGSFESLGQHQEWKAIKEKRPLQYMPYVEEHFKILSGIKLEVLGEKRGAVAKKGQLNKCLHLAGINPPKGPLIPPSQTACSAPKKEEETPETGLHTSRKASSTT